MIKGIIFDLDGVLVYTDEYHYQAWKELASELHTPFDRAINQRLRGVSRMESLEIILELYTGEPLSSEQKETLAERKNARYQQLLQNMTPDSVEDAVRNALAELKRRGYKLAVGSSSKNARTILERTNLTGMFDAISDGTNITRSKPDPEVFHKAAEKLGLPAGDCAVVEDAVSGIQAAKAAGMYAVGIGEAGTYRQADRAIETFEQLLDVFS